MEPVYAIKCFLWFLSLFYTSPRDVSHSPVFRNVLVSDFLVNFFLVTITLLTIGHCYSRVTYRSTIHTRLPAHASRVS